MSASSCVRPNADILSRPLAAEANAKLLPAKIYVITLIQKLPTKPLNTSSRDRFNKIRGAIKLRLNQFLPNITLGSKSELPVHLTIRNRRGSAEHYYHFLHGFLLPLVNWHFQDRKKHHQKIVVRSCAIMDTHIESLNLPGVTVINKELHAAYKYFHKFHVSIRGYDTPLTDSSRELLSARNLLLKHMLTANELTNANPTSSYLETPKVLVINRGNPDPFYASEDCERQRAGNQRRSIPNFDQLVASISHLNPRVILLENLSLAEQIKLFNSFDVIIAQHGAALANIIFCNQNTAIIEITPKPKMKELNRKGDYFKLLSDQMGLKFFRIRQRNSHANVNLNQFLIAVEAAIQARRQVGSTCSPAN